MLMVAAGQLRVCHVLMAFLYSPNFLISELLHSFEITFRYEIRERDSVLLHPRHER